MKYEGDRRGKERRDASIFSDAKMELNIREGI